MLLFIPFNLIYHSSSRKLPLVLFFTKDPITIRSLLTIVWSVHNDAGLLVQPPPPPFFHILVI